MAISFPVPDARPSPRFPVLSSRQEAFCRQFVATGNAAESASAGPAMPKASARQTGHALLDRPHIIERVRQIRLLWRETARREARLLLERLEQAWQVAVAQDSSYTMLQVIRMQAELSGLVAPRPGPAGRSVAPARRGRVRRAGGCPGGGRRRGGHRRPARPARRSNGTERGRGGRSAGWPDAERRGGRTALTMPLTMPREEPPAIAPDDPAVYADPPEEHYDAVDLGIARRGPDLQRGDDSLIDSAEHSWLYALRNGFDPIDPSSDEQIALEAENAAALAANPSRHRLESHAAARQLPRRTMRAGGAGP